WANWPCGRPTFDCPKCRVLVEPTSPCFRYRRTKKGSAVTRRRGPIHLKSAEDSAMVSVELELFTTKELVDELMRRKTFLGVVVPSGEDMKSKEWNGETTFKVHFNSNLNTTQASHLLETVAQYLEQNNV